MIKRLASVSGLVVLGVLWPVAPAGACPNDEVRAESRSTLLPDCRAYELVTPAFKEGTMVFSNMVSSSGQSLIGESPGALAGTEHDNSGEVGGLGTRYEFTRGDTDWLTRPLAPPASEFPSSGLIDASADLTRSLWRLRTPSQPEGSGELYRREQDGSYVRVGPLQPTGEAPRFGGEINYNGASQDLETVLISKELSQGLWPGDQTSESSSLYEYTGSNDAEPKLVGVTNAGRLASNNEAHLISTCGTLLGSGGKNNVDNAISADGSIVFFTALACSGSVNELYARVDEATTIAVSEPTRTPSECSGACASAEPSEGIFEGASEDGRKVFFSTVQPLLNSDKDATNDLYEAEIAGGHVARLTMVSEGEVNAGEDNDSTPGEGAEVVGVVRIATDGSHVYFVASGILSRGTNSEGDTPEAGANNLYVFDTASRRTAFVATLSTEDEAVWRRADNQRQAASNPTGNSLVFVSAADLTHEGTVGRQLYQYSAADAALERISIGQHSEAAGFAPRIPSPDYEAQDSPTLAHSFLAMSDDASYVFFESPDALTGEAVDDQPGGCLFSLEGICFLNTTIENIYEYHAGTVKLIATARPVSIEGVLMGVDASAQNIFFTTLNALAPQDTDTQQDIYDARIDGGFSGVAPPVQCAGEGCHPATGGQFSAAVPQSANQPGENSVSVPAKALTSKKLSRRQKLRRALAGCRRKKKVRQRHRCERQARRKYRNIPNVATARGTH